MSTRNTPSDRLTEILAGTRIKGRVQGGEDLLVRGRIEGHIDLEGTLSIEEGAVIKAEVRAQRVTISGTLVGNVHASQMIEVTASGRVQGDLRSPTVRIEDGARFSGLLEVGDVFQVEIAPRAKSPQDSGGSKKKSQVAGFVPAPMSKDERRRKRIVVKKRG